MSVIDEELEAIASRQDAFLEAVDRHLEEAEREATIRVRKPPRFGDAAFHPDSISLICPEAEPSAAIASLEDRLAMLEHGHERD
jgi:hypothetical protein